MDLSQAHWRKSSRSGPNGGACVELATNLDQVVPVRDTKWREGGSLQFDRASFASFIADVKAGRYDLP